MTGLSRYSIFACLFLVTIAVFCAEPSFKVKGESLTPSGDRITLEWQVESVNDGYVFYLNQRKRAEMIITDGKVVKIRRRVRFRGEDKWIVITRPLQIKIELRSGFYPFAAILNYRDKQSLETVMATGRFEILRSTVK